MLPDDWKKEIENAIEQTNARNTERHEAQIAGQNAIAAPLDRIAHQLVSNVRKQNASERAKGRRDCAIMWGTYAIALFTLIAAGIFYCQLHVSQDAAIDAHIAYAATQRPFITVSNLKIQAGLCRHWNCTDDECKADRKDFDTEAENSTSPAK